MATAMVLLNNAFVKNDSLKIDNNGELFLLSKDSVKFDELNQSHCEQKASDA